MFVAADLSDDDAARVMRATARLRARHPDARWTQPEQLHLTMVFIGATAPADVPRLEAGIADVAAGWAPFPVTMGEGGGFTNRRSGGVAWLRVERGREDAARLSLDLDQAMGSGSFEMIEPRPHLTLARGVTDELLDDVRRTAAQLQLGWTVTNVVLLRSHNGPPSRYEELSRHQLGGARSSLLDSPPADLARERSA